MKYGLALPTGGECGDPGFVIELAVLAEATGWDGVFLEDYICFQGDATAPTCDPWVALAGIAISTQSVRLGTMVTPLSRRRPWKVAREVAGIDLLSQGRMVLGVGLGDTGEHVIGDSSFTAFHETRNPGLRAEMLDEALTIITGLLGEGTFSFTGKHYRVEPVDFAPKPVQLPRVPIWVGGGYPKPGPTERALRWDGSCMYGTRTHDLSVDDVSDLRQRAGDRDFDICVGGRERREGDEEWLAEIAAAGVTWWTEYLPAQDREAMREAIRRGPLRID